MTCARATRFAQALGVRFIHVMAGVAQGDGARAVMVENLKRACDLAPKGLTLTLEPLCPASAPGYFLNDFDLAAGIIDEVGADNSGAAMGQLPLPGDQRRCVGLFCGAAPDDPPHPDRGRTGSRAAGVWHD